MRNHHRCHRRSRGGRVGKAWASASMRSLRPRLQACAPVSVQRVLGRGRVARGRSQQRRVRDRCALVSRESRRLAQLDSTSFSTSHFGKPSKNAVLVQIYQCSRLRPRAPTSRRSRAGVGGSEEGPQKDRRGPENRMRKPTCPYLPDERLQAQNLESRRKR